MLLSRVKPAPQITVRTVVDYIPRYGKLSCLYLATNDKMLIGSVSLRTLMFDLKVHSMNL